MPRECVDCLTVLDQGGAVYVLPQSILSSHQVSATEVPDLISELSSDARGFGGEPAAVALWLPTAALEDGKADVLRRLATLPLETLEEAERVARAGSVADGSVS